MQDQTNLLLDVPFPEERVFRYQAMQDILHHLVNNPFEAFTQRELATITGADVSSVSRSIDLMDQLGVLRIEEGKPARIRVDHDHLTHPNPLFRIAQPQFRTPVEAFLDELDGRIEASENVDAIVGVVLFGSVARASADRKSDIDLLCVLDGDGTHGRRIGSQVARDIEERTFDGDRYEFEVLVETPESASSHGEKLRPVFDEGIVLRRSDELRDIQRAVYADGHGGE